MLLRLHHTQAFARGALGAVQRCQRRNVGLELVYLRQRVDAF